MATNIAPPATIPTEDFLKVFAEIAENQGWCAQAEHILEEQLGLNFEPWTSGCGAGCCLPTGARFTLTADSPKLLDAAALAEKILQEYGYERLEKEETERLLAVIGRKLPTPPMVRVSFIVPALPGAERIFRRRTADRLYDGQITDFKVEEIPAES